MTRLTIVTKLRFIAAVTPIVLLIAAPVIGLTLYAFGQMPSELYNDQYAATQAASGMESSLYKMDWGRFQPDGAQIVMDQQRRFVNWVESAQSHIQTAAQADALQKITNTAKPLFDAMRTASAGDDSLEPRLRDLDGMITDLINADDGALMAISSVAISRARTIIIATLVAAVIIPWACFAWLALTLGATHRSLREIRAQIERLAERAQTGSAGELEAIDATLTELGYPKPNPMLAE